MLLSGPLGKWPLSYVHDNEGATLDTGGGRVHNVLKLGHFRQRLILSSLRFSMDGIRRGGVHI